MLMFMALFVLCAAVGFFARKDKKLSMPVAGATVRDVRMDVLGLGVCLSLLFLICGLRAETVGVDTNDYVDSFLDPAVLDRTVGGEAKFELGYTLFVKLIRLFSDSPNVFIFATAVVIFGGIYVFIRKNCAGSYAVALLVYVAFLYYIDFSAIRQAMALSIAINYVPYLRKKQWIPAVLIVLLGASFHTTALLLLAMIPFAITPWNSRKVVLAAILAVLGTILFEPLVGLILKFFPIYERYWNSEMMDGSGGVGIFAVLVILLCVFAGWLYFANKIRFRNKAQRNNFIVALIGSIFTIAINLLGRRYGIFSRMTRYFIPFVMILASEVYARCVPDTIINIDAVCGWLKKAKLDKYCDLERFRDQERYPVVAKCGICVRDVFYLLVAGLMGIYFYTIMRTNLYVLIPYSVFFA